MPETKPTSKLANVLRSTTTYIVAETVIAASQVFQPPKNRGKSAIQVSDCEPLGVSASRQQLGHHCLQQRD
jgi:hypothetical protein